MVREVREETGLRVKLEGLLDVATDMHFDHESKLKYHYVLVDYVAKPLSGKVRLSDESSAFGWFTIKQLGTLDMSEGTKAALSRYFGRAVGSSSGSATRPSGKRSLQVL